MTHRRNCPHCEEPMEYYPGEEADENYPKEPNVYSCPDCGWEEDE